MPDPQPLAIFPVSTSLQVLPAPIAPIASDSILYSFKGICSGLVQASGGCAGTLTSALDAIESAICSLQAGGGGGGSGGVSLNCGTLSPLLTAGNCIPASTGVPAFVAGYSSAGAPLRYYPYSASTSYTLSTTNTNSIVLLAPLASNNYNLSADLRVSPNSGNQLQILSNGAFVPSPTQFISGCADLLSKLKASTNGGCLPEDSVSATKAIALDALGNAIIRPIVSGSIVCADLQSKVDTCFALRSTPLSTVLGKDASGVVGYYPAPSGGTGGGSSSVTPADTSSIDMSVSQTGTIFTVSGSVIISPNSGNQIQSLANGLFVPTPSGSTQFISNCADLLTRLRSVSNGGCLPTSNTSQSVYIGFDSSGAPTIAPLPASPVQFVGNCADFNTRLISCPPTSSVAVATYLGFDSGGNPVKAPLPTTPASFVPDCATFLTRHAPTGSGGCVTQDTAVPTLVYAWDAIAGQMRIRPLPASSTPFIANCSDFTAKLKTVVNGGCLTSTVTPTLTYLGFDASGNPIVAPPPSVPASFISNCVDFLNKSKSIADGGCYPLQSGSPTFVYGLNAGTYGLYPLPSATQFISSCADLISKLKSTTNGGCLSTVTAPTPSYLGVDASGNPVIAPPPTGGFITSCADFQTRLTADTANGGCFSYTPGQMAYSFGWAPGSGVGYYDAPIKPATRWLVNAPAASTTVPSSGGAAALIPVFTDNETTKNPQGATFSGTTFTVARDGYYDISASVTGRIQSTTAAPANSLITMFASIAITRPSATGVLYRIGQHPVPLTAVASALSTGIDYTMSGTLSSIWLPAGSTIRTQLNSANVASAGTYSYNLLQAPASGQYFSITERTANASAV